MNNKLLLVTITCYNVLELLQDCFLPDKFMLGNQSRTLTIDLDLDFRVESILLDNRFLS
ncbi:hypothetical protein PEPS_02980 [Persicobacter psychrovividus]|uniref:Uncharacterized protein n=1 Tax=Persicobacter psychrovividus TaxID=387638 RepID=A0ABM7VAT0_9BACT|nr:hypothetical protein PEPS_02980 [Persicobacter psychrovividus]